MFGFAQSYPYAIANAVCAAFHYFIPGSRNLYDSSFKVKVYILVRIFIMLFECATCNLSLDVPLVPYAFSICSHAYSWESIWRKHRIAAALLTYTGNRQLGSISRCTCTCSKAWPVRAVLPPQAYSLYLQWEHGMPCFVFMNSCLYPQIVRMLTGMEVSPIAVQNSLEKLFPEERTLALAAKKAALAKKAAPVDGEEADGDAHAKASEPDAAVDARDVNTKTLAGPLNVRDVAMVGTVLVLGV